MENFLVPEKTNRLQLCEVELILYDVILGKSELGLTLSPMKVRSLRIYCLNSIEQPA